MTSYTKATDFASKDALLTGNPSKIVKGTEIDAEFTSIAAADADNVKTSALGTGVATFLATPSSSNLAAAVTGETGSGALVFATSPTLVTPLLGTPTSGTLTNCTGLPVASGISGLGTGVATALAVNVGSAGAPVVNGGVLGTPSSGTVTNLTGTASININGTVGATTPTTGAFTTLSASGVAAVGGATDSTVGVYVRNTALTGTDQVGVQAIPVANSSATTAIRGVYARADTAAAAFTVGYSAALYAANPTKGAGSTITNLHGLIVADQTVGTNNYGITSLVSSGANKYNIYASGTADNFFAGNTGFGGAPGAFRIDATATADQLRLVNSTGNAERLIVSSNASGTVFKSYNTALTTIPFVWQGSSTELMRLDASGNLGVGTNAPNFRLDVLDGTNIYRQLCLTEVKTNSTRNRTGIVAQSYVAATPAQVLLMDANTSANDLFIGGAYSGAYAATNLYMYSAASSTTTTGTQVFQIAHGKSLALQGATSGTGCGISFPSTQVASSDANTLDDYRESAYTGTLTGCTTAPTTAIYFTRTGNQVTIDIPASLAATSNSTACTITGGPTTMRPTTAKRVVARTVDNGIAAISTIQVGTDGTLTLYKDVAETNFTTSGAKGVQICSFSYTLI